jgi:tyrosyl-tRNA synthetase
MESLSAEVLQEAIELAGNAEIIPAGAPSNSALALAQKLAEARAEGRVLRVKFGVDPTSPDLHLGHTVGLRALRRFQDRGHAVVLVIGGYTAQLGDPTGRNAARPPLSAEQVAANAQTYLDQVKLILDMSKVEVVNNVDWLAKVDLIKLAALVTANQLLAKEAFGSRLEQNLPLGLHELLYPLLQGFDSVHIRADVEVGGSDQRFNILMGRHLQPQFQQKPQVAMLLPLLLGIDGVRKMSKSFGNAIGLSDSPDQVFTKVMSIGDELIVPFFELATSASPEQLDAVRKSLGEGKNPKQIKEDLACLLIGEFHTEPAADAARLSWNLVHSQRQVPENTPSHKVESATAVVDLLKATGLAASKAKARQLIEGGGVRLDSVKVTDISLVVAVPPPAGQVLQVGRRQFVRLIP